MSESDTDLAPFDTVATTEFRVTNAECSEDGCDGVFLHNGSTMVCNTCSVTIDLDAESRTTYVDVPSRWEYFHDNRPTYHHSGKARMVGGFIEPYEWKSSDDVDGTVSELPAAEFYSDSK